MSLENGGKDGCSFQPKLVANLRVGVEDVSEWPRVLSRVFEGYKLSPPKCPASPPKKKLLLSLQYISNYIGKIRRDEVSAHEVLPVYNTTVTLS